jgi:molybdenum cofactor cytidylyltransferase
VITAIILAAGKSKRFGKSNKLLAPYKRNLVLNHTLNKVLKSKVDEVLLVTGYQNNKIQNQFKKYSNIKFLFNKKFNKGMSSSIKLGLKKMNKKTKGFMICLGDMPKISTRVYDQIISKFKKIKNYPVVPFYHSKQGNPVCFPIKFKTKFMKINGDQGAKKFLKQYRFKKILVQSKSILFDIDHKHDLKN